MERWRERGKQNAIDLSEARLGGVNLIAADLTEANLSGADLDGANLSRALLIDANLSKANLGGANLNWSILRGANFHEVFLYETVFVDVDLSAVTGLESADTMVRALSIIEHCKNPALASGVFARRGSSRFLH